VPAKIIQEIPENIRKLVGNAVLQLPSWYRRVARSAGVVVKVKGSSPGIRFTYGCV
jgi:hypothetical protein